MQSNGRRNLLSLFLVLILLAISFGTTARGRASATLAAPDISDTGLLEGSIFSIDITIADITDMWGYEFYLRYDTDVLTAGNHASYDPFTLEWATEINEQQGYVYLSYSRTLGQQGVNITAPTPVARIDFLVDAVGTSDLDIDDSVISDSIGEPISHEVTDGLFNNTGSEPSKPSDVLLYAFVIAVVIIIIAAALVIYFIKVRKSARE